MSLLKRRVVIRMNLIMNTPLIAARLIANAPRSLTFIDKLALIRKSSEKSTSQMISNWIDLARVS
jgi:hypothetical protein